MTDITFFEFNIAKLLCDLNSDGVHFVQIFDVRVFYFYDDLNEKRYRILFEYDDKICSSYDDLINSLNFFGVDYN